MIRYILLWTAMMVILGVAIVASAEDDLLGYESMGDTPAEGTEQAGAAAEGQDPNGSMLPVDNECYEQCLKRGGYAFICENMCYTGKSKNPRKFSEEQYVCYSECTANRKNGALFCMEKCREYAKYKLEEDKLPVEKQGIRVQSSPIQAP